MIGIDTTVLVAHEIGEAPGHKSVRQKISELAGASGESFALTPQVLQEFLHVSTDPRRFIQPLTMEEALERADFWWRSVETVQCFGDDRSTRLFIEWMDTHRLGRKRILDTSLAAIYHSNGVSRLATGNSGDFSVFGVFSFESWAESV